MNKSKLLIHLLCTCVRVGVCKVCGCAHTNRRGISCYETALISVCKHCVINSLCTVNKRTGYMSWNAYLHLGPVSSCHGCDAWRVTASDACEFTVWAQSSSRPGWHSSNTKENHQETVLVIMAHISSSGCPQGSSSHHCSSSSTSRTADPPGPSPPRLGLLMTLSGPSRSN